MEIVDTILKGNTEALQTYLSGGGNPNYSEDDAGVTLLHHAVNVENYEAVYVLLDWGADPIRCDRVLQESPLELSVDLPSTLMTALMMTRILLPLR